MLDEFFIAAAHGGVVDAEEGAEDGMGGGDAVGDQEAVGQVRGVLATAADLALADGARLLLGVGLLVPGRRVGQQLVEDGGRDPRLWAEGSRGSAESLCVAPVSKSTGTADDRAATLWTQPYDRSLRNE